MSEEILRGELAYNPKIMRTEHGPAQGALVFTKGESHSCAQRTLLKRNWSKKSLLNLV